MVFGGLVGYFSDTTWRWWSHVFGGDGRAAVREAERQHLASWNAAGVPEDPEHGASSGDRIRTSSCGGGIEARVRDVFAPLPCELVSCALLGKALIPRFLHHVGRDHNGNRDYDSREYPACFAAHIPGSLPGFREQIEKPLSHAVVWPSEKSNIPLLMSSWCGEVRAETTRISSPQEAHKLGSSNHTLAINFAQFLRLTFACTATWTSSTLAS